MKIEPAYKRRLDHLCARRQPRRGRGLGPAVAHREGPHRRPRPRAEYVKVREQFARGQDAKAAHAHRARRATTASRHRLGGLRAAEAVASPACGPSTPTTWPTWPRTSTGRRSSPAGSWSGRYPADPGGRRRRRGGARPVQGRPGHAGADHRREVVRGPRRGRLLARQRRRRRHRRLCRRDPHRPSSPAATPCASRWPRRAGKPNVALSDFIAPVGTARLDRRLRRHRRPRRAGDRQARSRTRATTIRPSWPRPWPTGWPRPSPRRCTRGCAPSCGAMRPTRPSTSTT